MGLAAQYDAFMWSDCLVIPEVKEHEPRRDHTIIPYYRLKTYSLTFSLYIFEDTTTLLSICISEMVMQGFNNPEAISLSVLKERHIESG